jgi:hypothetical protein
MIVERSIEIETMDDDEGEYNAMNTFSARSQFRQIAGSEKAAAQPLPTRIHPAFDLASRKPFCSSTYHPAQDVRLA